MAEIRKQIGEKFTFAVDFTPKLPDNAALVSGVLLATRRGKTSQTTLTATVSPGDMTITILDDVKGGAALILNVGQSNEEPLLVSSISGPGPYIAALARPAQLAHAAGESIKYDQGATDLVLATPVATISGTMAKANIIGGLIYEYMVTFLVTTTTGDIIREDVPMIMHD